MNDEPTTIEYSEAFSKSVLNSLSAHIATLDHDGVTLETNQAWRRFGISNGIPLGYTGIGENYLKICETGQDGASDCGQKVAEGIRAVVDGKIEEYLLDDPCDGPGGPRWYYMHAIRMAIASPLRIVVGHEDITQLKLTEEKLRESEKTLLDQKQGLEEPTSA